MNSARKKFFEVASYLPHREVKWGEVRCEWGEVGWMWGGGGVRWSEVGWR